MWEEIKLKLEKLKNLDSDFVLFGADKHKYHSNPVASENQIQQIETILKVSLPIELREFYKNVGNGLLVLIMESKKYQIYLTIVLHINLILEVVI